MKEVIRKLLREGLLDEEIVSGKYYHGSPYPKIEWGLATEDYDRALFGYGIYVTTSKEEAIDYALERNKEGYLHSMNIKELNIAEFDDEPVSEEIRQRLESIPNFYSLFQVKVDPNQYDYEDFEYRLGKHITYDWDFFDEETAKNNNLPIGFAVAKYIDGKIIDEVHGLNKDEILQTIINYNDSYYSNQLDYEEADIVLSKNNMFDKYRYVYFYMSKKLNSFKEASKLFASIGIDGFKAEGFGGDWFSLSPNDYIVNIINPSKLKNIRTKKVTTQDRGF